MSTPDSNRWKDKYLAGLDDLEAKEAAWTQVETILRQSLSRLTLAVETSDQRLTAQLESLRQAIRNKATASQIGQLMEAISSSMLRLDQQHAGGDDGNRTLARLADHLEQQRVPEGLRQETRALKRQLRDARQANDLNLALVAYSDYLNQVLAWRMAGPTPGDQEGLFGRWFGRKPADAPQEHPSEAVSAPALALEQDVQDAHTDALPAFNQVLFDLLHRLDLPVSLSEPFRRITALLGEPPSRDSAKQAVADIAELMAKTRQLVEQEKQDIESFLAQLTGRLQELDRYLEEAIGFRGQADQQGVVIDERLSAEVAEIGKSLTEEENLSRLKQSIQAHLSNIQIHMDARKRLEQDRLTQADTEIRHLKQALNAVHEESVELRTRLGEARHCALHDALTGLHNRLAYDERIAQECERWARYGRPTVLSLWDVDHFKHINDRYGHRAGDNALKILGQLLSKHTRKSDFIARFGGEEFMLLLPETELQAAFEVAEKLRQLIATSTFLYRSQPVPITMSCGLAQFVAGETPETVYGRADAALYAAKQAGRNCCKMDRPSLTPAD